MKFRESYEQAGSCTRDADGFAPGSQFGTDVAGCLEGSDAPGTERMDLLGSLGQTGSDAQPPDSTCGGGARSGQATPMLLARLSASAAQRKEVV